MAGLYSILCTHHILSAHSSLNGHVGCFHVLTSMDDAALNTGYKYLFEMLILFPSDIYPEVELLDYMLDQVLIF